MSISELSFSEYAYIVGNYARIIHKPKRAPDLKARGYSQAAIKDYEAKRATAIKIRSLNLMFTGDLNSFEHPYFDYFMSLYSAYSSQGILPFPGALVDQPAKIIDIFHVLDQLKYEQEERQMKEQNRLAKQSRPNRTRK